MTFKNLRVCCLLVILAGCATGEDAATDTMEPAAEPGMAASSEAESAMAPAPPVAEPAMPSSYAVYFATESWLLGDAEESTIDDAVMAAMALGAGTFVIDGYADGSGTDRQNMRFSKLRAEAVADALIARGVAQESIQVSWHGAEDAAMETSEANSRRVTIEVR
jgi:OOP family OmpA-OmpF porin